MRISRAGLELIKSFEGFREAAVRLPDGRWIVGFGHVRTAREGLSIGESDAEELLRHDIKPAEDAVSTLVYAPLTQNQFDALVSLAFNISPAAFHESDILRALNVGDFIAAANGFDKWRKSRLNGRLTVVDALVRRRTIEKALFLEHPSGRPAAPTQLVTPEFDPNGFGHHFTTDTEDHPDAANDEAIGDGGDEPESDIAAAVRRLAERTREQPARPAQQPVQPAQQVQAEPARPAASNIDEAKRAVAERLAKILERTDKAIADSQAAQAAADKPQVQPQPEAKKTAPVVLEGLPDFDALAQKQAVKVQPAAVTPSRNGKTFIDDTEMFDPGRDASSIFEEAVRKEKIVNGTIGKGAGVLPPLNGRMSRFLPWIAILILSGLGLAVGVAEALRAPDPNNAVVTLQGASTVFAVFGLLLVMSVYFLATRARDRD